MPPTKPVIAVLAVLLALPASCRYGRQPSADDREAARMFEGEAAKYDEQAREAGWKWLRLLTKDSNDPWFRDCVAALDAGHPVVPDCALAVARSRGAQLEQLHAEVNARGKADQARARVTKLLCAEIGAR